MAETPALVRLESTASTNDEAMRLARSGAGDFTAVVADTQTAGRGRAGHCWVSPPGVALYLTVLLRPQFPRHVVPFITIAAGIAVAQAVELEAGVKALLKWPNDVLLDVGGTLRKVCGILCEAEDTESGFVVACGIGLNVNTPAEGLPSRPIFPATSLALATGVQHDRETLLAAILSNLRSRIDSLSSPDGVQETVAQFSAMDAFKVRGDCRVRVDNPGVPSVSGSPIGIDENGFYILETGQGRFQVVAGSLSLENEK